MTVAYFDCFSGISGDMILGAMVDAGVPFEELKLALANLPVTGYEINCDHVARCGIGATKVNVVLTEEHGNSHDHEHGHSHEHEHTHSHEHAHDDGHSHNHSHSHSHEHPHTHDDSHSHERGHDHHSHDHDHPHSHEHSDEHKHEHGHNHEEHSHEHGHAEHSHEHKHEHSHDHKHEHGHSHDHGHSHGVEDGHHHHGPHRGFSEIKKIIEASTFSETVKARSIAAFHRIAVEEAAVHESTIEQVHFHEVGAVDAIVDIVGSMWCIERLGITRVMSSQVAVGSGTIRVAHGEMPIPAPATARLLAGKPICTGPVTGELTTPTGAAILTTLTEEFGPLDNFMIERVAYGAGTRVYPNNPNYLRVLLGAVASCAVPASGAGLPVLQEELLIISAEIDDMPAELLGAALEALMAAGALDCHFVPIQMKKNRPAVSVHVLANQANVSALQEIVFRQTSTFGLKVVPCRRLSLRREVKQVDTAYGSIAVKLGYWGDEVIKASPEFRDCLAAAERCGVAALDVYQAAAVAAQSHLTLKDSAKA